MKYQILVCTEQDFTHCYKYEIAGTYKSIVNYQCVDHQQWKYIQEHADLEPVTC